jgi:hypothetical protein
MQFATAEAAQVWRTDGDTESKAPEAMFTQAGSWGSGVVGHES